MELAKEVDLPVIVHSREAAQDTFDLIKSEHAGTTGGVIHCFSGSKEMAKEYIKMGYYIGVGGVVTFKNARVLKEVVENIPLERILTETDCHIWHRCRFAENATVLPIFPMCST